MKQYTCDIAILGGGGAGLMAALRAEEAGLGKIALFEKGNYFGGSIIMAGGFFTTDPPSDQPDSEENAWKLYKAYLETVQYTGNTKLQKAYIFQTRFLSRWLKEKGVEISYSHRGPDAYMMMAESPTEREGSKRLGAVLVEMLESECRKSGVDMFLNACGRQVLLNEEGTAAGAVVSLDGEDVQVNAPIVVLACGGVTGSYDKLRVLKADGSIIPGLYAMGDNAGGFVTEHYFGSAGMTFALTSGFMSPAFFREYLAEA